ncbi:MAG TPA: DUF3500 domain-containing protein [Vicinamibacterales bacterium]|jgi:hypothetical protein|nr:DUF3500 domain-containing protein [Vicinamibacterales bacterium]
MDIKTDSGGHGPRFPLAVVLSLAIAPLLAFGPLQISRGPRQAAATANVVSAANAFLATLSDSERTTCTFDFKSDQRTGWSNLPTGIFQRHGLRFGDMTLRQREAALALVASALSREGYQKVTNIMNGDEVLKNAGGGRTGGRQGAAGPPGRGAPNAPGGRGGPGAPGGVRFGLDEYYVALLGTPSATAPWMIQFGGHHLAINVTLVGPSNVMTPSLPAAQPAKYTLNGQTIRPLGRENDKAFELINALNADQRKQAILNYQITDLVLGPGADGKVIQPEGIQVSRMNTSQQALLLDLAHEWVGILNDGAAGAKMTEIESNLPRTYFAWSGSTKNGELAYYRIQGPTLIIEYAPQQGDLDHIHTIYRDPTNDYGARLVQP